LLARGLTFDDIEEATYISADVHRVFFNKFLLFGSTLLYDKHVVTPASTTDPTEWQELKYLASMHILDL
jgi:hypothetical protein